jgi:hypothetical protein
MPTTCVPPYEEWSALLANNIAAAHVLHGRIGEGVVREVRAEVVNAAERYTRRLYEIAKRVGIALPERLPVSSDAASPIVMAGHQPVIYHPGLLEKTNRLRELARGAGALAINVSIDTDEGDGGHFIWPLTQQNDLVLKHGTLGTVATLFREQRVKAATDISEVFDHARRDLISSGLDQVAVRLERVSRLYQALAQERVVDANAIVRWVESGTGYLEVPLSTLVELPSGRRYLESIIKDGKRFASVYNATLDDYRRSHKIKNPANPFPNMVIEGDAFELPLWAVKGDSRAPLRVTSHTCQSNAEGEMIAPRGSINTLLLRGLCSDLFIHGLGGGKYDQFVDAFALAYVGTALPRYVVATATRYLFPEHLESFNRARDLKARYKEMVSHTERFLGIGIFSPVEDAFLREKGEGRHRLLHELREAPTSEDRSKVSHALNDVNRAIREFIDTSSIAQVLTEAAIDDARFARWACREFPFFFFQQG